MSIVSIPKNVSWLTWGGNTSTNQVGDIAPQLSYPAMAIFAIMQISKPTGKSSMTTLNISLPDAMRAFIDEQVTKGGYSTANEYIHDLIRQAQKKAEQEKLEAMLLAGLESGEKLEITDEWWEQKRAQLMQRFHQDS